MFHKILVAAVTLSLSSAVAFAGPVEVRSFDGYVKDVAQKTGKSEKEIRDEAYDALRKEGKFSDEDLERVRRGRDERIEADKEVEIISTLRKSESFQVQTGLSALRNDGIKKNAGDAFDAMKDKSADKVADKAADKSGTTFKSAKDIEADVVFLADVSKAISSKAMDAIKSVAPQNYAPMKKLGKMLLDRVNDDTANREANLKKDPNWKPLDPSKAEKLLQDVANSPKALEGQLVIGEGAYGACMKMKAEAIENMDDFIEGGNAEGKDPQSYTKGMGRRAAEKFKQDLEEGIFRVCTLASSGCRLFSSAIVNACKAIGGTK